MVDDSEAALKGTNRRDFMGYLLRVEFQKDRETTGLTATTRLDSRHNIEERPEAASRNLFIGNLDVNITREEIQKIFEKFGEVEDVDIKRPSTRSNVQPGGEQASFAFVRFATVEAAIDAKRSMDKEAINGRPCRVGYGRGAATHLLWVGNLPSTVSDDEVWKEFQKFGRVQNITFSRHSSSAIVDYEKVEEATKAQAELKGKSFSSDQSGSKLKIDFADPKSQSSRGGNPGSTLSRSSSGRYGDSGSSSFGSRGRDRSPVRDVRDRDRDRDTDRGGRRDFGNDRDGGRGFDRDRREGDRDHRRDSFDNFGRDFGREGYGGGSGGRAGHDSYGHDDPGRRFSRDSFDSRGGPDRGGRSDSYGGGSGGRGGWDRYPSYEGGSGDRGFGRDREDDRGRRDDRDGRRRSRSPPGRDDKRRDFPDRDFRAPAGANGGGYGSGAPVAPSGRDEFGRQYPSRDFKRPPSPPRGGQDNKPPVSSWDGYYGSAPAALDRNRSYGSGGSQDLSQASLLPGVPGVPAYGQQPPTRSRSDQAYPGAQDLDHPSKRARLAPGTGPAPPAMVAQPASALQFYGSAYPSMAPQQTDNRTKFLQKFATGWVGSVSLKNMTLKVQMQFLRGNLRLSDSVFPPQGTILTTSQRMRLEPPQLDALTVRMRSETDYAILFVLPATDVPDPVAHQDTFNRSFVPYLLEKQAAGIIRLNTGIIYLFPPCQFAFGHIRSLAPDLINTEADLREYLLAVVFRNV